MEELGFWKKDEVDYQEQKHLMRLTINTELFDELETVEEDTKNAIEKQLINN